MGLNIVCATGNICKDIELRYTKQNIPVIKNTIAIKRQYKNAKGEYDTDFINITLWRKQAEFLHNYGKKGSHVSISGRIETGSYENSKGDKVYTTEIVVDEIELLDKKPVVAKNETTEPQNRKEILNNAFENFGDIIEEDDNSLDLPF